MRPASVAIAVLLTAGCASGAEEGSEVPDAKTDAPAESAIEAATDTSDSETTGLFDVEGDTYVAPPDTTPLDTGPPDTGPPDTTPPDGCGIPTGTVASASGSASSTPDMAIDSDPSSYWNSGDYTGWLLLTFPKAQTIDSITVSAVALPVTSETYTVLGTKGGVESTIGAATMTVTGTLTTLAPIPVTKDAYDAIKISVGASASWIAIAEVTMHKIGCP
jgi:hypothetical protein